MHVFAPSARGSVNLTNDYNKLREELHGFGCFVVYITRLAGNREYLSSQLTHSLWAVTRCTYPAEKVRPEL